jgi:glycosyltransferase involved in cell wall biosynthesis
MARPRIALVVYDVYGEAGLERVVLETLRRTHQQIDWIVVSRSLTPDLRGFVEWRPARAPDRPYRLKAATFAAVATAQLARRRYDVLHLHGALLTKRADVATVHFLRDAFYTAIGADRSSVTRAHVALENAVLARARVLAAPSSFMEGLLRERFPAAEIVLTPNGVDAERFRPDAGARAALRGELGVPEGRIVGLFVGNAWTQKGLRIAVEAVSRVDADVELWVAGRGDPDRYRAPRVRFVGVRPDAERLYAAADVFVFPSAYETFPLSLLEAAASGLPSIVTRIGGVAEVVGDGEAGIVVQREPDAVAEALATLAADPARRVAVGAAARRRASEFTWERSTEAVLGLYERLLAG